jgi:hypothetical protein
MEYGARSVGLVGERLAIDTSAAVGYGDKVSCNERVAGLFPTIFRHKLPHADNTALKLFSQGWTGVVDTWPKEEVHYLNKAL